MQKMADPIGAHITRIYVNCSRSSPSPIRRSSNTAPVCTSTPINNGVPSNPSPQEKMALIAKEVAASQRSSDTFIRKAKSPPRQDQFRFVSKESGQEIDFQTGEGLGTILPMNGEPIPKKKKKRQTLAVVPPTIDSARSSKSSNEGDNLVPLTSQLPKGDGKRKTNFTSYDGLQMFTFTLDDD